MALSLDLSQIAQFFGSPLVEVVAGVEKKVYSLHTQALKTSESPSLRALVSERWDQKSRQPINWTHTDTATVERVFTYLYTGSYHIPSPCPRAPHLAESDIDWVTSTDETLVHQLVAHADGEPAEDVAPGQDLCRWLPGAAEAREALPAMESIPGCEPRASSECDTGVQQALLESLRDAASEALWKQRISTDEVFSAADFPYENHSYRESLLALARLCDFAVYHLLQSLQKSTLARLTRMLESVDCWQPHATAEVAELIKYVYENTPADAVEALSMRKVVSQFIVTNYGSIMRGEVQQLFAQGGDFTAEIAVKMRMHFVEVEAVSKAHARINKELERELAETRRSLKRHRTHERSA